MNTKMAKKQVDAVKKQADQAMASVKSQMSKTQKDVVSHIKKNPEQAALIAAAVGATLGALATFGVMRGKKKKKR